MADVIPFTSLDSSTRNNPAGRGDFGGLLSILAGNFSRFAGPQDVVSMS